MLLVNFMKKILELKIKNRNFNYHYMVVLLGFSRFSALKNVWFQKISNPPRKVIGNSEGEGGFKDSNFQGVRQVHGKLFSKG